MVAKEVKLVEIDNKLYLLSMNKKPIVVAYPTQIGLIRKSIRLGLFGKRRVDVYENITNSDKRKIMKNGGVCKIEVEERERVSEDRSGVVIETTVCPNYINGKVIIHI